MCWSSGREGGRESGATGSLSRCVGALHCVFLFPQGGLGLFVQLMPILILIIVSALSQMMVSSPPYSLSHRLLVPIPLKLTHMGRGWALEGRGGAGILPLFFLAFFGFSALSLDPVAPAASEVLLVLKQV